MDQELEDKKEWISPASFFEIPGTWRRSSMEAFFSEVRLPN